MRLPVFPLHTVLLPGVSMSLRIFEERYLRMLADRATANPAFAVSLIMSGRDVGDEPRFHSVATLASLTTLNSLADNLVELEIVGSQRVQLGSADWGHGYAVADSTPLPDTPTALPEFRKVARQGWEVFDWYASQVAIITGHEFRRPPLRVHSQADASATTYDLASRLPCSLAEQQRLLEERAPLSRMATLHRIIEREVTLLSDAGVVGAHLGQAGSRFLPN